MFTAVEIAQSMPITFDILAYAKKLRDAGFTQERSSGSSLGRHCGRTPGHQARHRYHPRDIKELEASLQRDMKVLKTTYQRDMKDMQKRMTIRLGAMLAVSITSWVHSSKSCNQI